MDKYCTTQPPSGKSAHNGAQPHHDANGTATSATQSGTPLTFSFSLFNNKGDNNPKAETRDWRGLCELLSQRRTTTGDGDAAKNGPAISGAIYPPGSTRGNENAEAVTLAILDFDDGATREEIEAATARLNAGRGAAAFIYSTFRHTPEAPKFRLVLPLTAPVVVSDWPQVWRRLSLAYDGKPDAAAKDAARLHFLPSCPKSRAHHAVSVRLKGEPLEVATLPLLPPQSQTDTRPMPQSIATGDPYARKTLENEIGRLCMANGHRNNALNDTAFEIGRLVGAGRIDRVECEAALWSAANTNGYVAKDGERETRSTIKSGLDAGEREPNYKGTPAAVARNAAATLSVPLSAREPQAVSPAFDEVGAGDIPAPLLRTERGGEYEAGQLVRLLYPRWKCAALSSHAAHAQRIFEGIGADLRFGEKLGWLVFDGRVWQKDDRHATRTADRAKTLSQVVRDEAGQLYALAGTLAQNGRTGDAEAMSRAAAAHAKHAKQAETKGHIEGALHFAAGHPETRVAPDVFDQRPWLLGFQNGVWDCGVWREHRREDFLLNLCPLPFEPTADRAEWNAVLERMTGGDADFARTLQDAAGYILSGASHLRFLPWLYGPKGTGKSTFSELLQTVLGKMAGTIDPKKLQDDAARERLGADLWNRRLAICAEAGNQRLDAELLKTLSGSDTLTVRFLYQEAFDALPRHVLLMVSNDAPRLDAYDDALKDRVVALPFVHRLDEAGPLELSGGARIEAVRNDPTSPLVRGFAAWALDGLARVHQTQTIFRAACIEKATAKFWADTDPLTPFWETRDVQKLRDGIGKTELRKSYEAWCEAEGARPFNRNQWARACQSYGLEDYTDGVTRQWRLTQLTQLSQFSKSPREGVEESCGLSGKQPSCVSCVSGDADEVRL